MPSYSPQPATPALDFLAFLQGRLETPGYQDMLDERDMATISQVIASQDERRARSQLLRMQARLTDRAFLEPADLARLKTVTGNGLPARARTRNRQRSWLRTAIVIIVSSVLGGSLAFGITVVVVTLVRSANTAPPAGTAQQQNPPAAVIPPAYSDLELFKQNWGTWQQLTPSDAAPQTGAPALLLLEQGGYYASQSWTVTPAATGWTPDLGGNVGARAVHGNYIDFTDADGNPGIAGVNQPFVVSTDPDVVLRIDQTGTVYQMTTAQATAVRSHPK
jgi:hypothetical protein